MSELSPADCAVAIRSFSRRLREHLAARAEDNVAVDQLRNHGAPSADALAQQLLALLTATARHLHGSLAGNAAPPPDPGTAPADAVTTVANRLADRIEQVPAKSWTDADLDAVRHAATEGGALLRRIEVAMEAARR
ncbi:MAG: hypothetical protein AB7L13_04875 [Acidimicrobiia bacterium]